MRRQPCCSVTSVSSRAKRLINVVNRRPRLKPVSLDEPLVDVLGREVPLAHWPAVERCKREWARV